MTPANRVPTHPGLLLRDLLSQAWLSQVELAQLIDVHVQVVHGIVRGRRGITTTLAWKLAKVFNNSPEFWMHAQTAYDLGRVRPGAKTTALDIEVLSTVGKVAFQQVCRGCSHRLQFGIEVRQQPTLTCPHCQRVSPMGEADQFWIPVAKR